MANQVNVRAEDLRQKINALQTRAATAKTITQWQDAQVATAQNAD